MCAFPVGTPRIISPIDNYASANRADGINSTVTSGSDESSANKQQAKNRLE